MAVVFTRAGGIILGNLLKAEAAMGPDGPLFEVTIGLTTSTVVLSPNLVYADFTAAAFSGYAALATQTFGTPYLDSDNQLQLTSSRLQWICTADGTPSVITGYYAWRPGSPNVLLWADQFATPVTIERLGDGIAFVINIEFPLTGHGTYQFTP